MYSLIFAEPVGIVVGVACGRWGNRAGRRLALQCRLPERLGAFVGTAAAHYLGACLSKAAFNLLALDPLGGGINVALTSPASSVVHGVVDAVAPDLVDQVLGGGVG